MSKINVKYLNVQLIETYVIVVAIKNFLFCHKPFCVGLPLPLYKRYRSFQAMIQTVANLAANNTDIFVASWQIYIPSSSASQYNLFKFYDFVNLSVISLSVSICL